MSYDPSALLLCLHRKIKHSAGWYVRRILNKILRGQVQHWTMYWQAILPDHGFTLCCLLTSYWFLSYLLAMSWKATHLRLAWIYSVTSPRQHSSEVCTRTSCYSQNSLCRARPPCSTSWRQRAQWEHQAFPYSTVVRNSFNFLTVLYGFEGCTNASLFPSHRGSGNADFYTTVLKVSSGRLEAKGHLKVVLINVDHRVWEVKTTGRFFVHKAYVQLSAVF